MSHPARGPDTRAINLLHRLKEGSAAMMGVLDTKVTLVNGLDEVLPEEAMRVMHGPCKANAHADRENRSGATGAR